MDKATHKVTGLVNSISTKTISTKRGDGTIYTAHIDGIDVELGFEDRGIEDSSLVTLPVYYKWNKWNYDPSTNETAARKLPDATTSAEKKKASGGKGGGSRSFSFPVPRNDQGQSICRQNALTNAVATLQYLPLVDADGKALSDDAITDRVVMIALKYSEFTTGNLDSSLLSAEVETE